MTSGGYSATTSDALRELSGFVHDAWFSLDDVAHAAERGEVRVPLLRGEEQRGRWGGRSTVMGGESVGTLVIRNVRAMAIDDEAQVGDYEVDYLAAIEDGRLLQLHATIPLRIDLQVSEIDVEFVPPENG
ncbi:MAG TPA: hypothetical protein VF257_09500 [Solirubrobacteraceae bacterium]